MNVYGYTRVSTEEQGESGLGLAAQRAGIADACAARGWRAEIVEEIKSGGRADNRPELQALLRRLKKGDALVVSKLDRLSRSTRDFADLLEQARRKGWSLVVLDLGLDLSTPMGEAMAGMVAVFSQLERRMIAQRTREALKEKRATGWRAHRFPETITLAERRRVRRLAAEGLSQRKVAVRMSEETGRLWHRSAVARIVAAAA